MPGLNIAAEADKKPDPFKSAAAVGGANPFAAQAAEAAAALHGPAEDGDDAVAGVHLNAQVPRDEFAHFVAGVADGGGDGRGVDEDDAGSDVDITAEEEMWIQEQIARDEAKRGKAPPPMTNLQASLDEMEDEMEHWMNAVEPDPATPRLQPAGAVGGTAGPPTPRSQWPPKPADGAEGSTLVRGTPRASHMASADEETQRVIDLSDPHGRCYTKAEFQGFYGGTQEFEAAKKAAMEGIEWEVIWPKGTAWRRAPDWDAWAGDGEEYFLPAGSQGQLLRMTNGFLCDEQSKLWLPLCAPDSDKQPGPQLVVLRPASARRAPEERRMAPDGGAYTKPQFVQHFGGTKEWDAADGAPGGGGDAPPAVCAPAAAGAPETSPGADAAPRKGKEAELAALRKQLDDLEELKRNKQLKQHKQHVDPATEPTAGATK